MSASPPTPPPPPPDEAHEQARERVQMPAMFLVANGVLNLLVGLFLAGYVVKEATTPAEALRDGWVKRMQGAEQGGEMGGVLGQAIRQARETEPGRFKRQRLATDGAAAAVVLVAAVLGVAGGVRMYRARTYSLAMVGALSSLLPCVTPTSACCVGEFVGVWCAIVLLLPGVRAGFR